MSANILRKAAALMRERAELSAEQSPGSWLAMGTRVEDSDDMTVARCMTRPDAQHIAAMSPAVALAVADWLDVVADRYWAVRDTFATDSPTGAVVASTSVLGCAEALVAARAYLGADS